MTTRTVTAWVPLGCALDGTDYAAYQGLGDFDPPAPPGTLHLLSAVGDPLPEVSGQTRAIVVTAGQATRAWGGVGPVAASGDVDVLVLPALASCALTNGVGERAGATVAPIGGQRVLVVGGAPGSDHQTPATFVARLDTGEVDPVNPEMPTPRVFASVTAFGDGAVVAGGESIDGGGQALDRFDVYSSATGGFDQQNSRQLNEPRAKHGAVVLASGQTLLVGGVGQDGTTVLDSLETIDPTTLVVNEGGLGRLATKRSSPTVLRLASGEILVAGGFAADGSPVQTLEWFEPDGTPSRSKQPVTLAQGAKRAFIALEAGGALAVVTPPVAGTPQFQNVWVIDATGARDVATPVGTLTDPVLFGGAGGAPVLWTGDRWLRWQPYLGAFGVLDVLDAAPASIGPARCSPDPGLALWLDDTQHLLTLLRFDTSNAYSPLAGPLLVTSPDQTAPDRLDAIKWASDTGLVLDPGTLAPAVFVTDRTYADVAIDVEAPAGSLPLAQVALRDEQGNELDVGGAHCAVPGSPAKLHVERRGQNVTWSADSGASGSCTTMGSASARVSVGVRGATSTRSVAKNLVVTRLGGP